MNDIEKINLWAEYQHSGDPQLREKIILEYASLVKIVAGRLNMYLGYAVEYDDLVGYGIFGLIDAIDKFDSSKEVKFETYASLRIRGAILDQIRKMDWIPRSLRQKQRKIDAAITKLESQFGRNATDEEIVAAAKAAHAHGFIKRLPNGYDTVIGEDGGNLSQGQKQLLCIARVMLCLPPMLILDEATSSIDTRTEMKIQHAFSIMMEGRTSFIVAHRLSTIKSADIIIVMKDGNIIEQGNHEELLAKGGFYSVLYNSQFS